MTVMTPKNADLFHRINDALSGHPETSATRDFYHAVKVFGWPSAAATGCLMAMVREVLGNPLIAVTTQPDTGHDVWWVVVDEGDNVIAGGLTELESVVSAMEAAS